MDVWEKHFDEKSGKYFYHNRKTFATVWNKPADYDGEDDELVAAESRVEVETRAAPSAVSSVASSEPGVADSIVTHTTMKGSLDYGNESTSEEEEEFAALPVLPEAPTENEKDNKNTKRAIGGNWFESFDRATGKVYYANTKTRETSWHWPEGVPKESGISSITSTGLDQRFESTQENFSSPSEYLASLETRIKEIENNETSYRKRIEHLEEQEGEESASLSTRRSLLFFGVKTLDEEDPVIVHSRAWQKMSEEERIADAAKHGIWAVIKTKLHSMICGTGNTDNRRMARSDNWLQDLSDEDRLDWNTDLAAIETFRNQHDDLFEHETKEEDDEDDIDLMFEMNRDDDPKDPAKFEASESLHLLTFYTCHQVFVDRNPLPQQWGRVNFFLGFSFFVTLMQNYVIYRLICLVAMENFTVYGVPELPNKLNVMMGNNMAVPVMFARQYVDYSPDFDPTQLNPNGCTKNDYTKEEYCDVVCDGKPCVCEHICVKRLLTWGEFGMRGGGSTGDNHHEDFHKKHWHKYAALQYTTESNWCLENRHRIFNTTNDNLFGIQTGNLPDNNAYVGDIDDYNTYKSFSVNQTIIKRCISCADVLATVRNCVRKRHQMGMAKKDVAECHSHSQDVVSECAGKMCASSMQVEADDPVKVSVLDFPALIFMYVVISLILVSELREMFICDTAFKRSVKNAKRLKTFDKQKRSLAFWLRILQQLRRFFVLPGIVILMCIANFSSESIRDVIGNSIEMGFLLDVDNLFFNIFFSTSGEKDLMIDLLKVRLNKTQEKKLNGSSNLYIVAGVTQMTFFAIIVFRGKRCMDTKTLDGLMKSVFLAQAFALLPLAYTYADINITKIQRYKKRLINGGKTGAVQNIIGIWKAIFIYGLDKFIVLCVPASTWISGFAAKYFNLNQNMGAYAPTTYIFTRSMMLLVLQFVPWHILMTTFTTSYIAFKDFPSWFNSLTLGDDMYGHNGAIYLTLMDWMWSVTPPLLSLIRPDFMFPGPEPYFQWSSEDGDYLKES